MAKQKLTLSIDKEIITQAKNQNINLSSFLEIRLIDHLSDKEKCSRREGNTNLLVKIGNTKDMLSSTLNVHKKLISRYG